MKRVTLSLTLGTLLMSLGATANAADFYVDPQNGAASGDGSSASPWKTLEAVVSAGEFGTTVKAGDTVHLLSGYHGELNLTSGSFNPPITIVEDSGQSAELSRVRFGSTSGWVLDGVSVSPSFAPTYTTIDMVSVGDNASDVTVQNCDIFSIPDATSWSADDWVNVASSGISVGGTNITIKNNLVKNVRFGISVDGEGAMIDHNSVVNFSADGLRGLGDNETFQYNLVKNSYVDDSQDANHDDGFQSWSVGSGGVGTGEVKNMVLRGNVIINSEDPAQPMKGTLQGIGCFDGFFTGWVVENNVVITNHWHGISLYGAKDSRIVNNTVIDNEDGQPGPPWILVTDHKDGTPSENVIVRNNLTTDLDVSGTNVTEDHNTVLAKTDFASYFVDAAKWDLHLLQTAPAVDQGSTDQAPSHDADNIPRPQGAGIDLGAYEWHEPNVQPDGGSGGVGAGGGSGGSVSGGAAGQSAGGSGAATGGSPGTGGSGTGGAKAKDDSGDSGGCGCRAAGDPPRSGLVLIGLGLVLAVGRRRRRNHLASM